ncbi:MAG: hypothetical protein LBR55_01465, partial [Bacteroidales bacterium]|nr:hypothetical protein [Bacteroidales bacterium]
INAWWNVEEEEKTITVTVRAFDEAGNYSAQSTEKDKTFEAINPTLTQTIELASGWNLISIYVVPENAAIEEIFAASMVAVDIIKNADGFYKPGMPEALQSLTEMHAGYGYLVKMKSPVTLTVEGKAVLNVSIPLKQGWNLIGYPFAQPQATTDVLAPIWTNTETIKNFDGFLDKTSGNLNTMKAGEGYYIKVTSDVEFNY